MTDEMKDLNTAEMSLKFSVCGQLESQEITFKVEDKRMALNSTTKKSNSGRDIKYLNKDFSSFRENLIEYAKTYFPQTYSDFNESSPGMMFIEMASYVGDVLSYYTDDTLKESMMLYAEDKQM